MNTVTQRMQICAAIGALMILSAHGMTATALQATRGYIENKGQVGDQHGRPHAHVRFLVARPGLNVQLRGNGFSYDTYTIDRCPQPAGTIQRLLPEKLSDRPNEEVTYQFHRVDVDLVDANPRPMITATDASTDYLNYYTHITAQTHGDQGATFVRGYARVTYHEVWPHIDMEWFLDEQDRPEYQFVVRPGGNVAHIRLRYRGADAMRLADGALELDVLHGTMRERLPRSYVLGSSADVDVRYSALGDGVYGFTPPPANLAMGETLVIDPMPEVRWSTYVGGTAYDRGNGVAIGADDDIVLAGSTASRTAIATTGAHKDVVDDIGDAYLAAFTRSGIQRWGTYYGGSGNDAGNAVTVMANGDIVLAGETNSRDAIATDGTHQPAFGGGYRDAHVAVFAPTGLRRWSTYYGGSVGDHGFALDVSPDENIVLVGVTASEDAIATQGAHQSVAGGDNDAFIAVFSNTGTRQWSTYVGGTGIDYGWAVTVAPDGNIVVTGMTTSSAGIATQGAHQPTLNGEADCFLVVFSNTGTRRWGTYYGGSLLEQGNALALTSQGDIVMAGLTLSSDAISTAGAAQQTYGGGELDAMVAMFSNTGTLRWGTYCGGSDRDVGVAVAVTPDDNIVLTGETSSTSAIATEGAHQADYSGNADAFLMSYSNSGTLSWGTYFGGGGTDLGSATAVMSNGDLVLVGSTSSTSGIATTQAHQPSYGGSDWDAVVTVFRLDSTTSSVMDNPITQTPAITSMHPNPASGQTVVTTSVTSDATLELVDAVGRVYTSVSVAAGTVQTTLATGDLPSGRYTVRIVPMDAPRQPQLPTQALIIVP